MAGTKKTGAKSAASKKTGSVNNRGDKGRYGKRCLGKGILVSNDMRETRMNNHDLIIAGTRGGKTGCIVYPQLKMAGDSSLIVTDSKRMLHRMFRDELEEKGFKVRTLDFVDTEDSCMYNPLDYIRKNKDGTYNEMDIIKISKALIPDDMDGKDPFWSRSARSVLDFFIGYCMEALPEEDHCMDTVSRLYHVFTKPMGESGFVDWIGDHIDSFVARRYSEIKSISSAEKTLASIYAFVNTALAPFDVKALRSIFGDGRLPVQFLEPEDFEPLCEKYDYEEYDLDDMIDPPVDEGQTCEDSAGEQDGEDSGDLPDNGRQHLDIASLGREKTVLFLNISDTDHSLDGVVNLLYTQVLQTLTYEADSHDDGRLEVPCRIIFDDFASGTTIPDYDKIISVVASRDIWMTMCIQSLSQLESLYSPAQAMTIRNNCDHIVYMGGNDQGTAEYIGLRAGKVPEAVMAMDRTKEYFIEGGKKALLVDKVPPYEYSEDDNQIS